MPAYLCPLSKEIMNDPVMIRQSGWSYDRENIIKWVKQNGSDPVTQKQCTLQDIIPNRTLRDAIITWKKKKGDKNNDDDGTSQGNDDHNVKYGGVKGHQALPRKKYSRKYSRK